MKEKHFTGDGGGFRELEAELSQQGNRFFRFAYSLCGCREDAEDIVVAAFANACQSHHKVRDSEALVTWLYRIVLNEWRTYRRRRRVSSEPLSNLDNVGVEISTDYIALTQALNNLSPKLREAVVLVKGEGLTLQEAAEVLQRPISTVAAQVTQGVLLLRMELFPQNRPAREMRGPRLQHELP